MAIPSSGQVSLNTVKNEFGDPNSDGQYKLSEYYRDGDNDPIPNSQTSIPASGAIRLNNFRGTSADSETYYVRKGTANSDLSFSNVADVEDEGPGVGASALLGVHIYMSGTSIIIKTWQDTVTDDFDCIYYTTAGVSTDHEPYYDLSDALLSYSNPVGVSSGYSATFSYTNISGNNLESYIYSSGYTAIPTGGNTAAITTSGLASRFGYISLAPTGDETSKTGVNRLTLTLTKSGSPTYTVLFVLDMYAEATDTYDEGESGV